MDRYTTGGVANNALTFLNWIMIPTDDDKPANADTVRTPFAALSDRTRVLMNALAWSRPRASYRTEDGDQVIIENIGPVPIYDPATDKWFLFRSPVVPPSEIIFSVGAPLGLNEWRYIYAKVVAGALAFETSTTLPDVFLTGKGGDFAFRYIGCLRTDLAGNLIPMRCTDGAYTYTARQEVLTAGTSTIPAFVNNLPNRVPPTARDVGIVVNHNNFDVNPTTVILRTFSGGASSISYLVPPKVGAAFNWHNYLKMQTDDNQKIGYQNSLNTNTTYIYVMNFWER